jgi:adenylyltransferase/sulfurtransferase
MDLEFSEEEVQRYSRHILLAEVGGSGQAKLRAARVLIVGAGGLGSPILLYLAAAGVGCIGVADGDTVDLSNLQRQVAHATGRTGWPKTRSAALTARGINPLVSVMEHNLRLTAANAEALVRDYDIICDASDNAATRYVLADACHLARKPMVFGAVAQFDGQVAVFPPEGPCYRCLHPSPPPDGLVPSCAEAGVLGAAPGVIGALQAMEVLKLILGVGEPLAGRVLLWDGLAARFDTLRLPRNSSCPLCGTSPSINALGQYSSSLTEPVRGI